MPAKKRPYRKPPILEAVIEFRLAEALPARLVAKVSKKLARQYDNVQAEKEVTFKLDVEHGETHVQGESNFFKHTSADQTNVVIVKPQNLAWSRLAPYEGWAHFVARVQQEMGVVADVIGLRRVTRIGLRYVNRIDVPRDDPEADDSVYRYEDYITININLPDKLEPLDAYVWRVHRSYPDRGLRAMMQSATLPPELPHMMSFLLDIDVVAQGEIPLKVEEMFAKLEDMRELKNELFEIAISDRARRGFE